MNAKEKFSQFQRKLHNFLIFRIYYNRTSTTSQSGHNFFVTNFNFFIELTQQVHLPKFNSIYVPTKGQSKCRIMINFRTKCDFLTS